MVRIRVSLRSLVIPSGKRICGVTILKGDQYYSCGEWRDCYSSLGYVVGDGRGLSAGTPVCRKNPQIINPEVSSLVTQLKAAIERAGHTNVKISITSDVEVKTVKNNTFTA